MFNRRIVAASCVVILALAAMLSAENIFSPSPTKATYLTFSGPVALPGVTLGTGTYMFEVVNSASSGDVIRVSSKDRSRRYFVGFTHRIQRPGGLGDGHYVTLGETTEGRAPRVLNWFPIGESIGHEFMYRR